MRLVRTFSVTFDVHDPDDYCADPRRAALRHLRRSYAGRCFQGAFILEVLELVRLGPCLLRETCLSGAGYVHAEFRARVSVRDEWDILTDVRISLTTPLIVGRSTAEGAPTSVMLLSGPATNPLSKGLTVAVRLVAQHYPPLQEEVTAAGTLLCCDSQAPAFLCSGELTQEDGAALEAMAERAARLLESRAELARTDAQGLLFFEGLLYAYAGAAETAELVPGPAADGAREPLWAGPPGVPLPAPAQAVDLLALVRRALEARPGTPGPDVTGLWCRDLALYRSSPLTAGAPPGSPPSGWETPTAAPPRTVFAVMLRSV